MGDPNIEAELNIREKLVHIDQTLADIDRTPADRHRIDADNDPKRQEIRYAPLLAIFTGMGAAAAFFAAGVAFVKVFH
jgi:hypothetical protein